MSKEQIEKMARIIQNGEIARNRGDLDCTEFPTDIVIKVGLQRLAGAKALYNAGYRKQSEKVIELPCKIGETMYVVSRYYTGNWEIFKCKVESITMYGTNTFISLISAKGNFAFGENVSSINKNVFFAEEEAKNAWAKMKGGAE